MIALLQPVRVPLPRNDSLDRTPALLVGRTYEEQTHYDARLPNGVVLAGIPNMLVEVANAP